MAAAIFGRICSGPIPKGLFTSGDRQRRGTLSEKSEKGRGSRVERPSGLGMILAVIGLTVFADADVQGFDWKYYGTNEEGSYFYETETMTRLSQNIVRVCVQSIYTERDLSHWVREGKRISKFGH